MIFNCYVIGVLGIVMKIFILFCYVKLGWDDFVVCDFDCVFNDWGKCGVVIVGVYMKSIGFEFDVVVLLFVVCCVDMFDGVWEGYGWMLYLKWDCCIYFVFCVMLFDVVYDQFDDVDCLLMCGYNFGFEDLILMLVFDNLEEVLCDDVEEKFLIVSIVEIIFDVDYWVDVVSGKGYLMWFFCLCDFDVVLGLEN